MIERPRCPRDGELLLMDRGVNGALDRVFCQICGWMVEREVVPRIALESVRSEGYHNMSRGTCKVVGCENKINLASKSGLCQKHGNRMQMFRKKKTKTIPLFQVDDYYIENPAYGQGARAPRKRSAV